MRQAYYACVSYTDAQVGKVLNELHDLGLDDNTLVVLWGDHGWHLGDYHIWGKHTLMETSLVSAFMIKGPGITEGTRNDHIVSAIDIYPTIMDYCGHGVSVRTPQYRLTRYKMKDGWRTELFNLGDERFERVNVAAEFPEVVKQMMVLWNKSNYKFF